MYSFFSTFLNGRTSMTNIGITVMVFILVLAMPTIDSLVCHKLKVSPVFDSWDRKKHHLLMLRKVILLLPFILYLEAVSYVVFFSRNASEVYSVQSVILGPVFTIDSGFIGVLKVLFTQGIQQAIDSMHFAGWYSVSEVYLNVMLFIPFGYLLPYVFKTFRDQANRYTVLCGFCVSLFIENIQLITRHGVYDVDDLITNTLGTLIGVILYRKFAYVVTNPDWRNQLKLRRYWHSRARKSVLGDVRELSISSRSVLYVTDEDASRSFFVDHLGFHMKKMILDEDSNRVDMLLQRGHLHLHLISIPNSQISKEQCLGITVKHIDSICKRLEKAGIEIKNKGFDSLTQKRCIQIQGPDGIKVMILE